MRLLKVHRALIYVLILALAANIFLFYQAGKAKQEGEEKTIRLAQVAKQLETPKKTDELGILKKKLGKLREETEAQRFYPDSPLELAEHLVSSAEQTKTKIYFERTLKASEKINQIRYQKERFSVFICGELENIESFLKKVGKGPFPFTKIRELKLVPAQANGEGDFILEILTPLRKAQDVGKVNKGGA